MSQTRRRDRDGEIVDFVLRYRLGTNAAIHRTIFVDQSINAVTKVTARLCACGLLRRYPLIPPETYFTVGPEVVRQYGISPRRTEPLGPQALPIEYGVLMYATHSNQPRRRLTPADIADCMQWMPEGFRRTPYCLTEDGRLELIRVDLGGSPQHVARKVAKDVSARLEVGELAELVAANRFQVVILTTTNEKSRLIASAIETQSWSQTVAMHMVVIQRLSLLQLRSP